MNRKTNKVNLLPEHIISKIAAGEVIDRPASVIKELIENALDAGADRITIELQDAGKTAITIKDNGTGIACDDLDKIFLRHTTSKISTTDDLFAIQSLGFRGEALYSIAAIADIHLQSKAKDQDTGWAIHTRGSRQLSLKPCAFSGTGTEIAIKELFFNTPARKKFLKSNTSEMNQILSTVIPYALLHNTVHFQLTHQGKTILDLRPSDNHLKRLTKTLNLDSKYIIETRQTLPEYNLTVHMILGDINIKRSRRDMQYLFINNRPVDNKNIAFHLNQIYRLILFPNNFPCFNVMITLPPEDIDVNIHPTKREVKIKNEQQIGSILRGICEHTLMTGSQIKQASGLRENAPTGTAAIAPDTNTKTPGQPEQDKHFQVKSNRTFTFNRSYDQKIERGSLAPSPSLKEITTQDYAYPKTKEAPELFTDLSTAQNQIKPSGQLHAKLKTARYIGPFHRKYLIFESGDSLLIIDQHAAQERIFYEKFIQQMQNSEIEIQHLLTPIVLKLTPQERVAWNESKDKLEEAGLSTNQFDQEAIAIQTHPQLMKNPEQAVRDLLAGETITQSDHQTIAQRACKASVRAGDDIKSEQAEHQRQELLACLDPFTCPHGRPTIIEMTLGYLDKQFLRT